MDPEFMQVQTIVRCLPRETSPDSKGQENKIITKFTQSKWRDAMARLAVCGLMTIGWVSQTVNARCMGMFHVYRLSG